MGINLIQSKPPTPLKEVPALVFIHGAWHGAWCWEENFFPYFTSKGFDCYAFDLPLHGEEKNKPGINKLRIADYVDCLKQAIKQINKPVVVIGHSMGGYILQNFLVNNGCAGAVLMASVPGIPIWRLFKYLWKKDPVAMLRTILLRDMRQLISTNEKVKDALFSMEMSAEKVDGYAKKLGNESFSLLIFDFFLKTIPARKNMKMPLLVQCAQKDELVAVEENEYMANLQKGELQTFENLAHDMMLEENWKLSAEGIFNWLTKHFLKNSTSEVPNHKNPKLKDTFPDAVQDLITTLGKNNQIDANKTKILGLGKSKRDN